MATYSTSLLTELVTIIRPEAVSNVTKWHLGRTVHAGVTWTRGTRALHQGETTVYNVLMVRTRYLADLTDRSRLLYDGKYYAIDSYHADKRANTIQITCTEVPKMTVIDDSATEEETEETTEERTE